MTTTNGDETALDTTTYETEDEEVTLNCITGVCGDYHDSDLDTVSVHAVDIDTEVEDDEDDDDDEIKRDGVVQFVTERLGMTRSPVVRPHATSPERPAEAVRTGDKEMTGYMQNGRLNSEQEDTDDSDNDADLDYADESSMTAPADDVLDPILMTTHLESVIGDDNDDDFAGMMHCLDDSPALSHDSDTFDETNWFDGHIGVIEDGEFLVAAFPKTKRVLSYSTLTTLNMDAGHSEGDLKRTRCGDLKRPLFSLELPDFSIGDPAISQRNDRTYPERTIMHANDYRERGNSCVSSDEEELDRQLGHELDNCYGHSRENTPIPLLTPPASPFPADDDQLVICEWPSNLTVDNAMTALLTDIRPMSPQSLEDLASDADGSGDYQLSAKYAAKSSALTPLLRGISMSMLS